MPIVEVFIYYILHALQNQVTLKSNLKWTDPFLGSELLVESCMVMGTTVIPREPR